MGQDSTSATILVVEDDPDIASALMRGLGARGYGTVWEDRIAPAIARLGAPDVTAAIIDVMIGDESGLDLVRRAREDGIAKPVLMLSALSEVEDRAAGIDAGADDYIVKPFSFEELVARLKVQERRAGDRVVAPQPTMRTRLESETFSVVAGEVRVRLTEREFQLLDLLEAHRDEVLSRGRIFDTLWAAEGKTSVNVVDVYIGYLRKKLSPVSGLDFEIKTIRNKGFCLTSLV